MVVKPLGVSTFRDKLAVYTDDVNLFATGYLYWFHVLKEALLQRVLDHGTSNVERGGTARSQNTNQHKPPGALWFAYRTKRPSVCVYEVHLLQATLLQATLL